jgi:hypothetical protein
MSDEPTIMERAVLAAERQANASERQADALEGCDLALSILAGLWVPPEHDEAPVDRWECSCGVTLAQSRDETEAECPNCHTCYIGDTSGKWIEVDTGR